MSDFCDYKKLNADPEYRQALEDYYNELYAYEKSGKNLNKLKKKLSELYKYTDNDKKLKKHLDEVVIDESGDLDLNKLNEQYEGGFYTPEAMFQQMEEIDPSLSVFPEIKEDYKNLTGMVDENPDNVNKVEIEYTKEQESNTQSKYNEDDIPQQEKEFIDNEKTKTTEIDEPDADKQTVKREVAASYSKKDVERTKSRIKMGLDRIARNTGVERLSSKLGRFSPTSMIVSSSDSGVLKYFGAIAMRMNNPKAYSKDKVANIQDAAGLRKQRLSVQYNEAMSDIVERIKAKPKTTDNPYYGNTLLTSHKYNLRNQFQEKEVRGVWNRYNELFSEYKAVNSENTELKNKLFEELTNDQTLKQKLLNGDKVIPEAVDAFFIQKNLFDEINSSEYDLGVDRAISPDLGVGSELPRVIKTQNIQNVINQGVSKKEFTRLIRQSILNAQPWLENAKSKKKEGKLVIDLIADGYASGLYNKALNGKDLNQDLLNAITSGETNDFIKLLEKEGSREVFGDLDTDTLKELLDSIKNRKEKAKDKAQRRESEGQKENDYITDTREYRRMFLDETTQVQVNGKTLRFQDLIEQNPEILLMNEINKHSGYLGAAQAGIKDFKSWINSVEDDLRIETQLKGQTEKSLKDLERHIEIVRGYERNILGEADFDQNTSLQQTFRALRMHQVIMTMGRLFFSQMMEMAKIMSYEGIGNTLKQVPAIMNTAGFLRSSKFSQGQKNNKVRNLLDMGLSPQLNKQSIHIAGYEENLNIDGFSSTKLNNINTQLDRVAEWSMAFNNFMDTRLRTMGYLATMDSLNKYATGSDSVKKQMKNRIYNEKRLNLDGFSQTDIDDFADLFNKYGLQDNGKFNGLDLATIYSDFDNDPNLKKTFDRYVLYLSQMNKRQFTAKEYSNLPLVQVDPWYKTVFQFRDHGIASLSEEFVYNQQSGQSLVATKFLTYGIMMGALVYMGQLYTGSIGREDQDEYLNKMLTWDKILAAATARLGFAAPFTATADQVLTSVFAQDAMFDYRFSGLGSDWLDGIPVLSTFDNTVYLTQLVASPMTGADLSNKELNGALSLFLSNHPGINTFKKSMASTLNTNSEE